MTNLNRISLTRCLLSIAFTISAASTMADNDAAPRVQVSPIGMAWAATKVNTAIFRHHTIATHNGQQYTAYFDDKGEVVIARRALPDGAWDLKPLGWKGNVRDAHNVISLGISSDGIVHMSYDHHGHKLRYRKTSNPLDLDSFGTSEPMTGLRENRVTYPQFVNLPNGEFLFFYRDGGSGNGDLCINTYDTSGSVWRTMHHPLITGAGQFNPYWCRPAIGKNGEIHLAWVWRRTGDASTNQNVSYAHSPDGGKTWQRSDGKLYDLPITPESAEIIDPVPEGSNLSNQDSSDLDNKGRMHVVYRKNDGEDTPQYFHRWHDGNAWRESQASKFTGKFDMKGGGTLRNPMSRPNLAIDADDNVYLFYRDTRQQGHARMITMPPPDYAPVSDVAILTQDLRQWEPTFDIERWKQDGILSLMALSSDQGHHETVTTAPASLYQIADFNPADITE